MDEFIPVQFLKVMERIAQIKGTEEKRAATAADMANFIK